jgi:choline-sulfatase
MHRMQMDEETAMSLGDMGITRREFLHGGAAGVASLAVAKGAKAQKGARKPNILWIMSDEHNHRVAGCYGNKIVQTPNIDALAASGVTFDTHYCNSPLCVPSRASLTAGKYVSRVSTWGNSSELPDANIPSLPRVLNAAGYTSYLCGKQHYDYSRRYGFTEWGGDFNNNYKTGLGGRSNPNVLTQNRLSPRFEEFHPGDHGSTVEHDRRVTAGSVDFFNKMPSGDKPFFLYAGYLAPHFPLIVPEEYWDRYKGKIAAPEIPAGFLDSLSLNYKVQRASFKELDVPEDTVIRGRELYYGLTTWVDNEIGKVLTALRARPDVAANTIIVYSSDHGENMGEHGLWWKNCMFEQAARVPLVISFPKRWKGGQRRVGASSHVDLVKTLVELGGGEAPADWNGTSMASWMNDAKHPWKDFSVTEYYAHATASGYTMMRSGEWKYVYHTVIDAKHPDQHELYNLKTDPQEFHNVAALPEHQERVAAMHKRMVEELGADPNSTEQRSRKELAVGYQRKDTPPKGAALGEG